MSKSLKNSKNENEFKVVERRLKERTGGLGFWAAVDYQYSDPGAKLIIARDVNKKWTKKS
jgi:hypothetical protein